ACGVVTITADNGQQVASNQQPSSTPACHTVAAGESPNNNTYTATGTIPSSLTAGTHTFTATDSAGRTATTTFTVTTTTSPTSGTGNVLAGPTSFVAGSSAPVINAGSTLQVTPNVLSPGQQF